MDGIQLNNAFIVTIMYNGEVGAIWASHGDGLRIQISPLSTLTVNVIWWEYNTQRIMLEATSNSPVLAKCRVLESLQNPSGTATEVSSSFPHAEHSLVRKLPLCALWGLFPLKSLRFNRVCANSEHGTCDKSSFRNVLVSKKTCTIHRLVRTKVEHEFEWCVTYKRKKEELLFSYGV